VRCATWPRTTFCWCRPTGCRPAARRRQADAQPLDEWASAARSPGGGGGLDEAQPRNGARLGKAKLLAYGWFQGQGLRIGGPRFKRQIPARMPAAEADGSGRAVKLDGARPRPVGAEDEPGRLGSACPDQARQPDDLPCRHLEGDGRSTWGRRVSQRTTRRGGPMRTWRTVGTLLRAQDDHEADQFARLPGRWGARRTAAHVAQNQTRSATGEDLCRGGG